ncbi:MAG: RagB/SusD family nutrient uptake outer membrane protein [Cyclobacteriaceae bacterium]
MKTFFPILLLSLFALGCEEFLQEDLQGTYSNSTFYETADHAELALTGVYNIMSFANSNNNLWVFGDVASDDAVKGGNPGDQASIQFIDNFDYLPSNPYLETFWTHYYEGITRANYLLYYLPEIDMQEERKAEIVAEATFLRAYFYFHLVSIFGEIPLKLIPPLSPAEIHVPLSTVDVLYGQVADDLLSASGALPVQGSTGRVTQGAALGLLAKVRLFQNDYNGALDAVASVEQLGRYSLEPHYAANFTLGSQNNNEAIFQIEHLTGTSPKLGNSLNQWFAPQVYGGYYFNSPRQDFVDEFETTAEGVVDPRLDYSVGREGTLWLNGEPFDPQWSPTGYISKKHLQPLSEVPRGIKGDGGLSYVFMRYAELLLIKAEALNELGRTGEALTPLNEVRKRARESYLFDTQLNGTGTIPAGLLPDVTSASQGAVREAIRHERRVELGLEFHRYYDLMRYGATVAERALSDTQFSYEFDRYFLIPLSERDINKAIQ